MSETYLRSRIFHVDDVVVNHSWDLNPYLAEGETVSGVVAVAQGDLTLANPVSADGEYSTDINGSVGRVVCRVTLSTARLMDIEVFVHVEGMDNPLDEIPT